MSNDTAMTTTESALSKVKPHLFVAAWRDNETVAGVAKQCGITKDEARAMAAALRGAGVKLPKKSRGRKTIVSKREVEELNRMLMGQLTDASIFENESEDDE